MKKLALAAMTAVMFAAAAAPANAFVFVAAIAAVAASEEDKQADAQQTGTSAETTAETAPGTVEAGDAGEVRSAQAQTPTRPANDAAPRAANDRGGEVVYGFAG